jgi:hypothetical protein
MEVGSTTPIRQDNRTVRTVLDFRAVFYMIKITYEALTLRYKIVYVDLVLLELT